ncbi:MAG: hypothetical protein AAB388_03500 [Patescibacteria group bacterium]
MRTRGAAKKKAQPRYANAGGWAEFEVDQRVNWFDEMRGPRRPCTTLNGKGVNNTISRRKRAMAAVA